MGVVGGGEMCSLGLKMFKVICAGEFHGGSEF